MLHSSLVFATRPQRPPAGWLVFSSSLSGECGFAVVDSVLGRDAVAPGKSPLLRSGLAWSQEVISSHSPLKGSLWLRRQGIQVASLDIGATMGHQVCFQKAGS